MINLKKSYLKSLINLNQRNRLVWFSNEQKILSKQIYSIDSLTLRILA